MSKRKSPLTWMQKFATVGLTLTVIQVGLLIYLRSTSRPLTAREAIESSVERSKVEDPRRKDVLRIQTAVRHFQTTNKALPKTLDALIPIYFDAIPFDINTGKPFTYRVDGKRFFIGEGGAKKLSPNKKTGDGSAPLDQESLLIESLTSGKQDNFIYDPQGKRDPFEPFNFNPNKNDDPNKTPLEKFSIGQLKVTAVLEGFGEPTAIVENTAGQGFTVKKGTKIGTNKGVVVEIQKDKLLILEEEIDFTGQKKTRTVEMKLRVKEDTKSGDN